MSKRIWTAAEDEIIRKEYPDGDTKALAARLKVKPEQLWRHAKFLKVGKSEAYMEVCLRACGKAAQSVGSPYRFKPGIVPANKGLRRPGYAPGRMRETQFKKGLHTWNWVPIGTERVRSDGYLCRKMSDTGYPPRDWVTVHTIIWKDAGRPLPKGHKLRFKDGDKTNIKLDNLALISDSDLMLENTVHTLPPDLVKVIYLTGALKRKINRRLNNAQEHAAGSSEPPLRATGSAGG